MPMMKKPRGLTCALIASACLISGCDHIKYHIDRAVPTAANPYRIEIPCEIASADFERKVGVQTLAALTADKNSVAERIQRDCAEGKLPQDEARWTAYLKEQKSALAEEEGKIKDEKKKKEFGKRREVIEKKLDELNVAVLAQNKLKKFVGETLPGEWVTEKVVGGNPPSGYKAHVEVTARSPESTPKDHSKNLAGTLSDRGQQAFIEYVAKQDEKAQIKPAAKPALKSKPNPKSKSDAKVDCEAKEKPDPKEKLNAKDSKGEKAVANLLKTLRGKEQEENTADSFSTRRSIPLLISTAFNSNSPADRLEKVYIFIQPLGGSKVLDVDKVTIETVKGLAAFGKETTTQEAAPFFSLENLPFGTKATGKGGVASSKLGRQLERTLTRQFALRTISLNSDRDILIIRQEGQEGTDVTGSVLSTVSLQLPNAPSLLSVFSVTEKESDGGDDRDPCGPAPPPMVKKSLKPIINVGDVEAAVTWIAVTRVVRSGAGTITEEDDEVRPIVFANQFKTKLWSNELALFTLRLEHKVDGKCYSVPLVYRDPISEYMRLMVFKDYPSAERFQKFLGTYQFNTGQPAKVKVDSETIEFGLPIDAEGNINPKKLNFDWKPATENAEATKKRMLERIQSIFADVSEPKYFPLRAEFPAKECD